VENRPGASANIAAEAVVRAPPDGYTLLLVAPVNAINATLYQNLNFNFVHDIAPVASIAAYTNVMLVNPSVPAKSVSQFIAYAKANPGKINMASGGNGAPAHIIGEYFKTKAGIDMVHVPYRGEAPALTDLLGGQVQVYFASVSTSIEYIRGSQLRALAVTTATRSEALPDIPVMADFLPGFEFSPWVGVGAPQHTPSDIIGKLNKEINAALGSPVIKARLADLSATPLVLSPAGFGRLIADDLEKWAKVIQAANIKPE
jgi:tripartite-type tricarboxylate transporter receptor subunit TctC